ncbi:ImmA/IrrE family metallo-endopeptidase [Bosea sp. (in: a-proteobacteria)]|jgi:Zn-dependent peptidase ImmA (M78 family)|uniref:ImmA/IrrE family metallo-endopeptidase n=1 Tax=Bosea sp. (in: a-proteobacteria) TaxID=1871050 RepID=UPI003F7033E2
MKPAFLTDAQIDARALAHRRELGFRDDQGIDFITLMTKLKRRYPNFAYERVPDSQLGEAEAQWDSQTKRLLVPEAVYAAANRGEGRALMTVAHEVGHALLGHEGALHRAPAGNRTERLSPRVRAMEYQARRYAAAFLIPDIEPVRHLSAGEMSEHYGVSMSAAMLRKSELR